ncbi:MAG TPA: DUF917 domain-containing protein [Firmicutes bacterium]|nr:DUF917 domain-containing protein [Bacillota bacterium]
MPSIQLKTLTDIEDFARGATFFGTGGGGSMETGVNALKTQLDAGREIGWVDVDEVSDSCFTASAFGMGSIAPKTEETYKQIRSFGLGEEKYPQRTKLSVDTLSHLERFIGKQIDVLVPAEIGGGNSCNLIAAAAESGRVAVDGDYAGRAVPSIFQTGPYVTGMPLLPIASLDQWGDVCFIEQAANWRMAERIGKHLSMAAFLGCTLAGFPMSGANMKQALFRNTMTECLRVGRLIREARGQGEDAVEAVAKMLGGWVLCRGVVSKKEWWDRDGYYWGHHVFTGTGDYSGVELKVFFQNENHICWRNGELLATSPDMIIAVDDETCEPLTNTVVEEGMKMAVIGLKARIMSRSPKGIEVLGPRNFGLDIDYVPIEDNM